MAVDRFQRRRGGMGYLRVNCSRRRLAREGHLVEADDGATFTPVMISSEPSTSSPPSFPERFEAAENSPSSSNPIGAPGRIEIVLGCGRRVVVDNGVDSVALARVLAVLERP